MEKLRKMKKIFFVFLLKLGTVRVASMKSIDNTSRERS